MAGTIDNTDITTIIIGLQKIKVAAHHITRQPDHHVFRQITTQQVITRQNGTLDHAGITDRIQDLFVFLFQLQIRAM
jgi:hypothetical protein